MQTHRLGMTHRGLLLFKWLMILIPPVTVAVGHSAMTVGHNLLGHTPGTIAETLLVTLLVTLLALVLSYMFVEKLFRIGSDAGSGEALEGEPLHRRFASLPVPAVG